MPQQQVLLAHLYQLVLDCFDQSHQRSAQILSTLTDVQAKIALIQSKQAELDQKWEGIKMSLDKALAELADKFDACNQRQLDAVGISLDTIHAQVDAMSQKADVMGAQLHDSVSATPMPASSAGTPYVK